MMMMGGGLGNWWRGWSQSDRASGAVELSALSLIAVPRSGGALHVIRRTSPLEPCAPGHKIHDDKRWYPPGRAVKLAIVSFEPNFVLVLPSAQFEALQLGDPCRSRGYARRFRSSQHMYAPNVLPDLAS